MITLIKRGWRISPTNSGKLQNNFHRITLTHTQSTTNLPTVKDYLQKWTEIFSDSKNNIPEPDVSANYLMAFVLGNIPVPEMKVKFSKLVLNEHQIQKMDEYCHKRLSRMPVQYILNEWDFINLTLKMKPPVLIPRPETEQLVTIVLDNIVENNVKRILEIGSGTGAISIFLLKSLPQAMCTAVDVSEVACKLTEENAIDHKVIDRLEIINQKLENDGTLDLIGGKQFDLIVSNPPYLYTSELNELQPELRYEDEVALDGGEDGLCTIKAVLRLSSRILENGQKCFMEVHHHHGPIIENWLKDNDYLELALKGLFNDYGGYQRFVYVEKK